MMEEAPAAVERRTFLDAVLAFGFVSTAVAIIYPVWRYLIPPPSGEPSTASVVAARLSELKPNTGLIFRFGSKPGLLVRAANGELHAVSATCTHLECTVQYKTDAGQIWCACHNGFYDLTGTVVSGPPPRPLERFAVQLRGEGADQEVVVSRT